MYKELLVHVLRHWKNVSNDQKIIKLTWWYDGSEVTVVSVWLLLVALVSLILCCSASCLASARRWWARNAGLRPLICPLPEDAMRLQKDL